MAELLLENLPEGTHGLPPAAAEQEVAEETPADTAEETPADTEGVPTVGPGVDGPTSSAWLRRLQRILWPRCWPKRDIHTDVDIIWLDKSEVVVTTEHGSYVLTPDENADLAERWVQSVTRAIRRKLQQQNEVRELSLTTRSSGMARDQLKHLLEMTAAERDQAREEVKKIKYEAKKE